MTGRERLQRIQQYYAQLSLTRVQLFMSGALSVLPCWGDDIDNAIVQQLDGVTGPVTLGLWFWEI